MTGSTQARFKFKASKAEAGAEAEAAHGSTMHLQPSADRLFPTAQISLSQSRQTVSTREWEI